MNTVLITGSSSGFGQATAKAFAQRGWNVVATMRDPTTEHGISSSEHTMIARLDVQDVDSIGTAVAAGIDRFGGIDVVVNNAGYGLMTIFEGVDRTAIQKQFDVNVFGVMDVTRAVLPHFRSRRQGTLINISSGAGIFGAPMASVYSASKFALEGYSEALWYELGALGIKVKLIEPGGAPGTRFMSRSSSEANRTQPLPDYSPFVQSTMEVYAGMASGADADAVSKVVNAIFEAATDKSDRLRYQPTNDISEIVRARRSGSEDQYFSLLRSLFVRSTAA